MNSKTKILLVDDEKAILKFISIKLRISGYEIMTASGGHKAIELIRSESPDIMLLDVIMPGMDGFEVLKILREFSIIPVIVFSARPENAAKAIALGANDFMPKPFDVNQMLKKIEQLLKR